MVLQLPADWLGKLSAVDNSFPHLVEAYTFMALKAAMDGQLTIEVPQICNSNLSNAIVSNVGHLTVKRQIASPRF